MTITVQLINSDADFADIKRFYTLGFIGQVIALPILVSIYCAYVWILSDIVKSNCMIAMPS